MSKKSRPEKPVDPVPNFEPQPESRVAGTDSRPSEIRITPQRDWFGTILRIAAVVVLVGAGLTISRHLVLIEKHLDRNIEKDAAQAFWVISRKGSQPEDREKAFKHLVAAGNKEWRSAALTNLNLNGIDLSQLEFTEAYFDSCKFKKANFRKTDLKKCQMDLCVLREADLTGADCSATRFFKADLTNAILQGAILRKSNFEQAKMRGVILAHSELSGAELPMADLTDADLRNANLDTADLRHAKLVRARLAHAIMPRRIDRYTGIDFTDSNWWRARGIPSNKIDEYQKKFPPSKDAPYGFYDDYQLWLKSVEKPAPKK